MKRFRPGGAFPFLRPPAGEFHGAVVSFDEVWSRRAHDLRERLLEDPRPAVRFRLLERFLLDQITRPLPRHPAVAFALKEFQATVPGPATVSELPDRIGISQRRFIEVFRDQVGLTPKVYYRLRRFQQALRRRPPTSGSNTSSGRMIDARDLAPIFPSSRSTSSMLYRTSTLRGHAQ